MESNYPLIWDSKNHPKISPMIAYKIRNLSSQQNASKRDVNNIEGGTNGSSTRRTGQDTKSQLFHTSSPQRHIALSRKRQEVMFDPKNNLPFNGKESTENRNEELHQLAPSKVEGTGSMIEKVHDNAAKDNKFAARAFQRQLGFQGSMRRRTLSSDAGYYTGCSELDNDSITSFSSSVGATLADLDPEHAPPLFVGEKVVEKLEDVCYKLSNTVITSSRGTLFLTNYKIHFQSNITNILPQSPSSILNIPLGFVTSIQKFRNQNDAQMESMCGLKVSCKDFREYTFVFPKTFEITLKKELQPLHFGKFDAGIGVFQAILGMSRMVPGLKGPMNTNTNLSRRKSRSLHDLSISKALGNLQSQNHDISF